MAISFQELFKHLPLADTVRTRFFRIRRRNPHYKLEFQMVVCNGAGRELATSSIVTNWRLEDALELMMIDPNMRDVKRHPGKLDLIQALADIEEYLNLTLDREPQMWR